MKTTAKGKRALASVDSITMFSPDGWKRLNKLCGHITDASTDEELAMGFMDFRHVWYEDNGVTEEDFAGGDDEVHDALIGRWSDYIIGD